MTRPARTGSSSERLRAAARRPVTAALIAVTLVATVVDLVLLRGAPSPLGLSEHGLARRDVLAVFTSGVVATSVGELVIVVALLAIGVGWAERVLGGARTVLAFVVSAAAGASLGAAVQAAGMHVGEYWARHADGVVTFDPFAPTFGTLAAASAFAPPLWRRRLRATLFAVAGTFLLYSGRPADLDLMLSLVVGLMLGAAFSRGSQGTAATVPTAPGSTPWRSSLRETRLLLALVTLLLAVGPVVTALTRSSSGLLSPLGLSQLGEVTPLACGPLGAGQGCTPHPGAVLGTLLVSLLPLVVLAAVARGMAAGSRAAALVAVAFGVLTSALAIWYFAVLPATQPDAERLPAGAPELVLWTIVDGAVPLALAVLVLMGLRSFPARAGRRAARHAALVVGGAALVSTVLYLGLGTVFAEHFRPSPSFTDLVMDLPERFLPGLFLRAEQRAFVPHALDAALVYRGVGPLFWIAVLIAVVLLTRSARRSGRALGADARLRDALHSGGGALSFMATWPGLELWVDEKRDAVIAYRRVGDVAVTLSGPVGRDRHHPEVLRAFVAFCDAHAWIAAFYSVGEEVAGALGRQGWRRVVVAEETLLDPAGWDPAGRAFKDIRTAVNRALRDGTRARLDRFTDLPARIRIDIASASEQWVAEKRLPELGFTLGGLDELTDPDVLVAVALDADDRVCAVTSWLPVWQDGVLIGRTLDFMRRLPSAANGTMEFLIATCLDRFRADGLRIASLSAAPLAVSSADVPDALDRVLSLLGRRLEPAYGFRSLLSFKRKFNPRLEPLWLVVRDPLTLPAVGLAIARAYLPGLSPRGTLALLRSLRTPLAAVTEPPVGIEPTTYALRERRSTD